MQLVEENGSSTMNHIEMNNDQCHRASLTAEQSQHALSNVSLEAVLPDQKDQLPSDVTIEELPLSVIDDILEIANQRAALLDRLREAVRNGNINELQRLAATLCGLTSDAFEE